MLATVIVELLLASLFLMLIGWAREAVRVATSHREADDGSFLPSAGSEPASRPWPGLNDPWGACPREARPAPRLHNGHVHLRRFPHP